MGLALPEPRNHDHLSVSQAADDNISVNEIVVVSQAHGVGAQGLVAADLSAGLLLRLVEEPRDARRHVLVCGRGFGRCRNGIRRRRDGC